MRRRRGPERSPPPPAQRFFPPFPLPRLFPFDFVALADFVPWRFLYSRDITALSQMARVINTTIFTKNGPFYAGLGEGGEGHTSFTIASPTGEGMTGPISFSRLRRCVLVDHFRIV